MLAVELSTCLRLGLRRGTVVDAQDLVACLSSDPRGRVARFCDATTGLLATRTLTRLCVDRGVDLSAAFPACGAATPGGVAACVEQSARCETCRAQSVIYGLDPTQCDVVDDGLVNASCP